MSNSDLDSKPKEFGHGMRGEFFLEENYVNYNHGSYGTVARSVRDVQNEFIAESERNPDKWFRVRDNCSFVFMLYSLHWSNKMLYILGVHVSISTLYYM